MTPTARVARKPSGECIAGQVTDENGNSRESFRDLLDRVLVYTEHPSPSDTSLVRYAYNPLGELTQMTDAEGNVSTLSYDLRGLLSLSRSRPRGR